jgi:hypothetical protein
VIRVIRSILRSQRGPGPDWAEVVRRRSGYSPAERVGWINAVAALIDSHADHEEQLRRLGATIAGC